MAKRFINDLVVNGGLDAAGLTGTVPSGVLPEATSSDLGAVTFVHQSFTPSFWNTDSDTINHNNSFTNVKAYYTIIGKSAEVVFYGQLTSGVATSTAYKALRMFMPFSDSSFSGILSSTSTIVISAGTFPNYVTAVGASNQINTVAAFNTSGLTGLTGGSVYVVYKLTLE